MINPICGKIRVNLLLTLHNINRIYGGDKRWNDGFDIDTMRLK